jgi:hypothetical protein
LGTADIWVTTRATTNDDWGTPLNLGSPVNGSAYDAGPNISVDGLLFFFHSNRAGGYGSGDIYMRRRATEDGPWGQVAHLEAPINGPAYDFNPAIAADGSILYFASDRPGGAGDSDIWQVTVTPTVDFNGDEMVEIKDLLRLIESWDQDDRVVDIGPTPFGDGIVDAADLEVLMSYWGQEIPHPALVTRWKFDETEGDIAHDSAGTYDATLFNEPTWRPTGGQLDGALELDGLDDFATTAFILDPSAGAFSVFAWVKGGGFGQAVISQAAGANWLMAAAPNGALMTELKGSGRTGKPLTSVVDITDGVWHRVGFTWDGSNRVLYVDDVEVARDMQSGPAGSTGGLYIGADSALSTGTFWSGLIDDVRIYNVGLTPDETTALAQ